MNKFLSFVFIVVALAACQPAVTPEKSDIEKDLEGIGLQNVAKEIPGIEVYMVCCGRYSC